MLIGHFPAGYCLTTFILKFVECKNDQVYRRFFGIGLIASILPDVDMIYYYLIDHRQHLHHSYWTHIPIYWIIGALCLISLGKLLKCKIIIQVTLIGFFNIILHLFLDTITGKIHWLFPFSNVNVFFFDVPSNFRWWVINYLLHWTFAFEIILVIAALYKFNGRRNPPKMPSPPNSPDFPVCNLKYWK